MTKLSLKIKIVIAVLLVTTVSVVFILTNKPLKTNDILVKIKYKDPQHLIRVSPFPEEIEIKVEGTEKKISRIKNTSIEIDLTEKEKGISRVEVKEFIKLPAGIKILRYAPEFINIHLETRAYKRFPVHVFTTGKPSSGHWLIGTRVEPPMVLLSGPTNIIKDITKVSTKPVDISNINESFRKEIVLDLDENVENRSGKIYATLEIQEKKVIKNIKNIPVRGLSYGKPFKIVPEFVDIEIKGPEALMRQQNIKEKIDVFIDMKGLKKGIYVRRAVISIPLNFTLVKAKPANFTVKID